MLSDDDESLRLLLKTIREVTAPERVYLFGSRVRSEERADSDYDLLVLTRDTRPARAITVEVRRRLVMSGIAFDLFVMPPEEYARWSQVPGTIARTVAQTGVLVDG